MPICPFMENLAVEKITDPKSGLIIRVIIHLDRFNVSERYCRSIAKGKGCRHFKNGRCELGWDGNKLMELVNTIKKRYEEKGIDVQII